MWARVRRAGLRRAGWVGGLVGVGSGLRALRMAALVMRSRSLFCAWSMAGVLLEGRWRLEVVVRRYDVREVWVCDVEGGLSFSCRSSWEEGFALSVRWRY